VAPPHDAEPLVKVLTGFTNRLREAGLTVGTGQLVNLTKSFHTLDPASREDLYWAGRACLVSNKDDIPAYDLVFADTFDGAQGIRLKVAGQLPPKAEITALPHKNAHGTERPPEDEETGTRASDLEILRDKDFSRYTEEDKQQARALLQGLTLTPPQRRTRRTARARKGTKPDLRRALRDLTRHDAHLPRHWRTPKTKPRALVLILDISGSMKDYSRMLLHFAHTLRQGTAKTEVFCFGTRLTRLTPHLSTRDPDEALDQAAAAVIDWDGGTRIGESLATYNRTWGRKTGLRGAVTILCTDGLERGDPDQLGREMQRLQRLSHRVIWLNPLAADARYEPLTRGAKATMPSVGALLSGHSVGSLQELADLLAD
jgi:uncharacterized protein with von Willebrand factor type A (vWA) domain